MVTVWLLDCRTSSEAVLKRFNGFEVAFSSFKAVFRGYKVVLRVFSRFYWGFERFLAVLKRLFLHLVAPIAVSHKKFCVLFRRKVWSFLIWVLEITWRLRVLIHIIIRIPSVVAITAARPTQARGIFHSVWHLSSQLKIFSLANVIVTSGCWHVPTGTEVRMSLSTPRCTGVKCPVRVVYEECRIIVPPVCSVSYSRHMLKESEEASQERMARIFH